MTITTTREALRVLGELDYEADPRDEYKYLTPEAVGALVDAGHDVQVNW